LIIAPLALEGPGAESWGASVLPAYINASLAGKLLRSVRSTTRRSSRRCRSRLRAKDWLGAGGGHVE